jgi:hypothetical protein
MSKREKLRAFIADIRQNPAKTTISRGKAYRYGHLDPASSEIRLLCLEPGSYEEDIHCRLKHVKLKDKPTYEALSYMWGDATVRRIVFLSGHPHSVTENLEIALRHLRKTDKARTLWIDALCINQNNLKERAEQVQKMKKIFDTAGSVLAWLGEATEDSDEAFVVLQELSEAIFDMVRTFE